jgi:hypothetical protein
MSLGDLQKRAGIARQLGNNMLAGAKRGIGNFRKNIKSPIETLKRGFGSPRKSAHGESQRVV